MFTPLFLRIRGYITFKLGKRTPGNRPKHEILDAGLLPLDKRAASDITTTS